MTTQQIRRVLVEGGGVQVATAVSAGDTVLPITDPSWFNEGGGQAVCGQNRITYAGLDDGGSGSLVGLGAYPSTAPMTTLQSGTGLEDGLHEYAATFVTSAGESLPSPLASITTGAITPPSSAPTGSVIAGSGVDDGTHAYQVTFYDAAGETTVSPTSGTFTTYTIAAPSSAPGLANDTGGSAATGWVPGDSLYCEIEYLTSAGQTTPSAASSTIVASTLAAGPYAHAIAVSVTGSSDPNVTFIRIYVNVNGSWRGYTDVTNTTWTPILSDVSYAGSPAGVNTAQIEHVSLTIPIGPKPTVGRKVYRQENGSGTFKLAATVANNTATSTVDSTPAASLGAAAPSSNTAAANQVALSLIPIGQATVTARKIYRTQAGGSQLKLLTTLADNTTTTYADSAADASLGANVPTSDSSGLTLQPGQVVAGSTSMIVAGTNWASASGGWAVIGNGQQVIRYTGISGNSLIGIPSSGVGAITASVTYGSTITGAPALTGIPATGVGSILYDIAKGDQVNLLVVVDDLAAQAALAQLMGFGDGVIEDYQTIPGISETEARAQATAYLSLRKTVQGTIDYLSRDPKTASGKTVHVNLTNPNPVAITGDFLIQQVNWSMFRAGGLFPTAEAQASNIRFTFEDLLRLARKAAALPS